MDMLYLLPNVVVPYTKQVQIYQDSWTDGGVMVIMETITRSRKLCSEAKEPYAVQQSFRKITKFSIFLKLKNN